MRKSRFHHITNRAMETSWESRKFAEADHVLQRICQLLKDAPQAWTIITTVGWWKLLESSDLPAPINDVLRNGFNPHSWAIQAISVCPRLAREVAERLGSLPTQEEAAESLRPFGLENIATPYHTILQQPNLETLSKVRGVLHWDQFITSLPERIIKLLGLFWFSYMVLDFTQLLPHDALLSTRLADAMVNRSAEVFGVRPDDLLDELRQTIERLGGGYPWADSVIRLPELV